MRYLYFFMLLVVSSCGLKDEIFVVDVLSVPTETVNFLSDVAENIDYVPLETKQECLIGHIHNFSVTDNGKFYVNQIGRGILAFDSTGKFLYKLDNEGRGPGEYGRIIDFDVSRDDKYLVILTLKSELNVFEIEEKSFNLLQNISLKGPMPGNIDIVGKNNIVLTYASIYGFEPFHSLILSLSGDTIDYRENYCQYVKNDALMTGTRENIVYKYGDIRFKGVFSDTVFAFNDVSGYTPSFILDSRGKLPMAEDRVSGLSFNNLRDEFLIIASIYESYRYLFYCYEYKGESVYNIFDKETSKKYYVDNKIKLKDDLMGGINFFPLFTVDGVLFMWVDASVLKKHIASDDFKNVVVKYPEKKQKLLELATNLDETDNPVLIVVR
jgi:hypothetical protein